MRCSHLSSEQAQGYRNNARLDDNELTPALTTLDVAAGVLLVWSSLRVLVDVSCAKVDGEGMIALLLCTLLAPRVAHRAWRALSRNARK